MTTSAISITGESVIDALLAEASAVRASVRTREMGHTSYVTKAELRRQAAALTAMRALAIRANGFNALPAEVAEVVSAALTDATDEAIK